ncbi:MAG: hypothetical protein OXD31_16240 [Chloroflexi bacterium]|nr:hypothetical protein [Chloroflexota bacterium]
MRIILAFIYAVLSIALVAEMTAGLNIVSAQSPVDYDTDNDGLIEIEWLEQLNAVRWDLDGDGFVDEGGNVEAYSASFPDAAEEMGCMDGCRGYELARGLDFRSAGSFASGSVNSKWATGNGWLPIGVNDTFHALFDGNSLTISNLFINRTGANQPESIGLFGVSSGDISGIGLVDAKVTGESNVGGIAGTSYGRITSSYITGSVSGLWSVGALVGHNDGKITFSYAATNVMGHPSGYTGGLVGRNEWNGVIESSYATGNVVGGLAGGLVGSNFGNISSSYASGGTESLEDGGFDIAGGLSGSNAGSIRFSYASGGVSSPGREAGGLVGNNGGLITTSYATGSTSSGYIAGGLVAYNSTDGYIASSYSTGTVVGSWVGGFVGQNIGSIGFSYTLSNVIPSPNSDSALVGGFAGSDYIEGETIKGEVLASFWLKDGATDISDIGEGSVDGIRGLSATELQGTADYTGIYAEWLTDFDNADGDFDDATGQDDVWDFGTSSQYPELKADIDGSGHASWWEFGEQHGRPAPTPTPTPLPTDTPTPTLTPTVTSTPTITPTPTQTATPSSTPIPTETPIPTDTPVPTATATHTSVPTDTPAPTSTPEPSETPVPPTQTPQVIVVVVTATPEPAMDVPSEGTSSGGGCNSIGTVPVGSAAANLFLVFAPLAIIGGVRWETRRKRG